MMVDCIYSYSDLENILITMIIHLHFYGNLFFLVEIGNVFNFWNTIIFS